MRTRCLLIGFTLAFILCLAARPASAEEVIETWRAGGFNQPYCVSVNSTDGSCWVADSGNNQVVHLAEDGTELWRGGSFYYPQSVSVNPTDGSCWVADGGHQEAVHLAEDGTELWRGGDFTALWSVSVNAADGSCWATDPLDNHVVHLAEDGTELWRSPGYPTFRLPQCVSVNPTDGSCWVADTMNSQVVHLADTGTELWRGGGFDSPLYVSVNPTDGSCWVADSGNVQVVHLAEDGTELWRGGRFDSPWCVSVNPTDGSCWVADTRNDQVVHLAENGTDLWRGGGFYWPTSVSVNSTDGSCWVADSANNEVVHLVICSPFDDVGCDHWARDEIVACCEAGIVSGYGEGLYEPTWPVSRAQMAVFIARALAGGDENVPDGPAEATFDDVPTDHWGFKYVEYCVITGVVQGFDPVTYGPTVTVSRDAMAVFIARAVAGDDDSVPDGPAEATFDDVPTDHWAYKYVEYCSAEGIVQGYSPVTYGPTATVSRDQMAVFISRAFELL